MKINDPLHTFIICLVFSVLVFCSCNQSAKTEQLQSDEHINNLTKEALIAMLDTVFRTEQEPLSLRDSLMDLHGAESELVKEQQNIYEQNHIVNEKKVLALLDNSGWPKLEIIGERGSRTICNVIQHTGNNTRTKYLPMMKKAVLEKQLNPQLLVRAEDRIATESGELQIYGGQMKYYPETKSFNVWPVFDPENIDKRRAEIGLGPIKEYLKDRFNFEWDLEEQKKRSTEFEKEKLKE